MKIKHKIKAFDIACSLAAGFCLSSTVAALSINVANLDSVKNIDVPLFIIIFVLSSAALAAAVIFTGRDVIERAALFCFSISFACAVGSSFFRNAYVLTGLAIILCIIFRITVKEDIASFGDKLSPRASFIGTCVIFVAFFVYVYINTSYAYKIFGEATYDFGIFSQMFEQMARTGAPVTSVERDGLVSHFAVHFSPVYYLFLPGYFIFRTPLYLYAIQAAAVGAGVFAVWMIARKLGFSPKLSLICAAIYAFYPTMSYGCFYDFHENKFLTVFILWTLYFILSKKYVPAYIFAFLTLSVKEDAVLYVAVIGLWLIISSRERIHGAIIVAVSVLYFIFATKMISVFGGEAMFGRFANYIPTDEDGGMMTVIKTIMLDFGYFIGQVFTAQKFSFILFTLVPTMFIMFRGVPASTLVLLVPVVVENLMSNWPYQADIFYQYTFGSAALIVFAVLISLSHKDEVKRNKYAVKILALCIVFVVSISVFETTNVNTYNSSREEYKKSEEILTEYRDTFEKSSVAADTYFVPHLYYVKDLHPIPKYYGSVPKVDYIIADTRDMSRYNEVLGYAQNGYELYDKGGFVEIYISQEFFRDDFSK